MCAAALGNIDWPRLAGNHLHQARQVHRALPATPDRQNAAHARTFYSCSACSHAPALGAGLARGNKLAAAAKRHADHPRTRSSSKPTASLPERSILVSSAQGVWISCELQVIFRSKTVGF